MEFEFGKFGGDKNLIHLKINYLTKNLKYKMLVGSKVRMLHGFGEGIVTKINGDQIMVLLEQGIEIPVHRRELVLISNLEETIKPVQEQKQGTAATEIPKPGSKMFFVKDGVYLAALPINPMLSEYYLVNFTDYQIFIVAYKLGKPLNQFFQIFQLVPKSFQIIPEAFPNQSTNHWVGMQFQILKFHQSQGDAQTCKEFRLSFSMQEWKKSKVKIPLLEKEGWLLQLDGMVEKINAEELKNSMLNPKPKVESLQKSLPEKKLEWREIDLHIEKLDTNHSQLAASEILGIQIKAFEKALDNALIDGIGSLIAIHGVGNGILKTEIHRRVSGNPQVKFFKEARKEKFGFGATEIQLK